MVTLYGSTVKAVAKTEAYKKVETYRELENIAVLTASNFGGARKIDISWLKAASEEYQISPNINDYLLVDIPIVTADFPNRNLQCFPMSELTRFNHHHGKICYKTFEGKPLHQDHDNNDYLKAKGIIISSVMDYVPKYNIWKVRILAAFDRSKDTWLAKQIIDNKRDGYSMGAHAEDLYCSVCGQSVLTAKSRKCFHLPNSKGDVLFGRLVYEDANRPVFFETSSVDSPADFTAKNPEVWL